MTAPLTLEAARRVARSARCTPCGGSLVIDHDADDHGIGRLFCLACGHATADVQVAQGDWPHVAVAKLARR